MGVHLNWHAGRTLHSEDGMRRIALVMALFAAGPLLAQTPAKKPALVHWQAWSPAAFEQAKRENRFVLLDLEAVWCHWCHVMDETTYRDPQVVRLLESRYVLVKVDQDSRPDLSNRYEDYGWPATVVFAADGSEIVKRQGYITPAEMVSMLQAIITDPSPGPSVRAEEQITYPADAALAASVRNQLKKDFLAGYDEKHGSWGFNQKYLDWDSVEYAMDLARVGDRNAERMAKQTLHAQLQLLDPAWGGVYQYSTDGDWKAPHFEKIMQMQAENMRIYALAYAQWGDPEDLHAATEIRRFIKTFLTSPQGAFYTSQDADLIEGKHSADYFALDDAGRRKLGIPRVDRHMYARENGWMIAALATLYSSTGEREYLDAATRAAKWCLQNRSLPGGGFRHDAVDKAGPYLGDNAAMARAFLALYTATGDRAWLARAETTAAYIEKNFRIAKGAGYVTVHRATDRGFEAHPQRDENIAVLRFANLLAQYTGNPQHRGMAENAMRYLAAPSIAQKLPAASVLLTERQFSTPALHLTVSGHKDDPKAQELFQSALRYAASYKRLEWWDSKEGRLPNPDVMYPELSRAALFVCTGRTCSQPIFQAHDVRSKVDRLTAVGDGDEGKAAAAHARK